jgi:CheY-like chemotaxis protein
MVSVTCEQIVMVVDDDQDLRSTLAEILAEEGYGVLTATDGRDALERLRGTTHRPCVILLDLMMPIMDGHAFYAEQHRDPDLAEIPVVILSAHATMRDAIPADVEYLPKPTRLDSLLDVVSRYCA